MSRRKKLRFALAGLLLALAALLSVRAAGDPRPRVAPELLARIGAAPALAPGGVRVTWTGVAGVIVELGQEDGEVQTILVDPYVTRHSFVELTRPIDTDAATAERAFPAASTILVGHAHHDHLADVPALAARTGAAIYGNESVCHLAWSMGVPFPAQCHVQVVPATVTAGLATIELIPAPHGESAIGVPFPGTAMPTDGRLPYLWELKEGGPLAFVIRANGRVIYHHGSAGLDAALLARIAGLKPDLALIGISLRQRTPDFEARLLGALQPKRVAAIHHDDFFGRTLADEVPLLRGVDLPGFEARVKELLGPGALVRLQPFTGWEVPAP